MIHVIAIITAKPGKREEVLAAFRANMPAVHGERGCIEYGPAIDAEGGGGRGAAAVSTSRPANPVSPSLSIGISSSGRLATDGCDNLTERAVRVPQP